MRLTLFIHKDTIEIGRPLQDAIIHNFGTLDIQIVETLKELKMTLKRMHYTNLEEIIILFLDNRTRLAEMNSISNLLEGTRLIIILPDKSKETISLALSFYPRFFTQISQSYYELCEILKKMVEKPINS